MTKSKVYQPTIDPDASKEEASWSETTTPRVIPNPDHENNPYWSLRQYSEDEDVPIRFPSHIIKAIGEHWLLLGTKHGLRDTYGMFGGKAISGAPIINQALADMIEELDPGANEFIEIPQIWDITNDRRVAQKYYLLNILRQLDCLDPSCVAEMDRGDGTKFKRIKGNPLVRRDSVQGFHLWRDAITHDVFVSDEFARRAEEVGVDGVRFSEKKLCDF